MDGLDGLKVSMINSLHVQLRAERYDDNYHLLRYVIMMITVNLCNCSRNSKDAN